MSKECELREKHKIIRCDIGNCETCERVFNWTEQVKKETAKQIYEKGKELYDDFDMTGLSEYIIANFLSKENENETN